MNNLNVILMMKYIGTYVSKDDIVARQVIKSSQAKILLHHCTIFAPGLK